MSRTINIDVRMESETCWRCGIAFAMDWRWQERCENNGATFYCPKGCALTYGEGALKKKQREIERLQRRLAYEKEEHHTAEARRRAEKAAKTRLKNRVSKGVPLL